MPIAFTGAWREGLLGLEAAKLLRNPIWRGEGVPEGEDLPVLLVPGLLVGDNSLRFMSHWLRCNGFAPEAAGIRVNIGCSEDLCQRLEKRAEELAAEHGRKIAIIGQSRGGILARVVAGRRPDLVKGIVTLGAPVISQLSLNPILLAEIAVIGAIGTTGVPGFMSRRCLRGSCCEPFRHSLHDQFPNDVHYTALYSRTDGVVDWQACLDPAADDLVEVRTSHCGMGLNVEAYTTIAHALDEMLNDVIVVEMPLLEETASGGLDVSEAA